MTMNKIHLINMLICFIYLSILKSLISVSSTSTVCEETDGSAKQYRCAWNTYLMTVL